MASHQSGFSLAGVLIAVGLGGLILASMTRMINLGMRANKQIEQQADLESMRRSIVKSFDCQASLGLAAGEKLKVCKIFPLLNRQGIPLVSVDGKFASTNFYLRQRCVLNVGIFFEYMRANPSEKGLTAIPDPLTGRIKGFEDLFPHEVFCSDFFKDALATLPTLPDIDCAPGRVLIGIKGGLPVCGEADPYEDPVCTTTGGTEASVTTPTSTKHVKLGGTTVCTKGALKQARPCQLKKNVVSSSRGSSLSEVVWYSETCTE